MARGGAGCRRRSKNESRKLIELHLAEYCRQTAELVKNLSAVGEDQADELKNVVKAHTEALNQASGSFRSQLKNPIGAFTQDIKKTFGRRDFLI